MGTKRKSCGSVRVSVERKLSPQNKRRLAERRRQQERPQEEQPWWMRQRPGG